MWTGLIKLIGVISATAIAVNYHEVLSAWVQPGRLFGPTGPFLFFCVLLLSLIIMVNLLAKRAGQLLKGERLHWATQGMGLLVGAIRGLWLAGCIVVIFASTGIPYLNKSVTEDSAIGPRLEPRARGVMTFVVDRFPGTRERVQLIPSLR